MKFVLETLETSRRSWHEKVGTVISGKLSLQHQWQCLEVWGLKLKLPRRSAKLLNVPLLLVLHRPPACTTLHCFATSCLNLPQFLSFALFLSPSAAKEPRTSTSSSPALSRSSRRPTSWSSPILTRPSSPASPSSTRSSCTHHSIPAYEEDGRRRRWRRRSRRRMSPPPIAVHRQPNWRPQPHNESVLFRIL